MHRTQASTVLALAALVGGVASALYPGLATADEPKRAPAKPAAVMASEAIQAPAISPEVHLGPAARSPQLVVRRLPVTGRDKGSSYTDASLESTIQGGLTALERAKLDQARAAVAYARMTGPLYRPLPSRAPLIKSREEMDAAKLRAAQSRVGLPVVSDPAAGTSGNIAPLQLRGPEGLSELERAKLEAILQGRPVPTPKPVATPSRRVHSPDAAAPKSDKERR